MQRRAQSRCAGFSLVEIMVGMVIGMLGIIVMMQVFALAETQKRATTGGGDAQSNGAIALYGIQRDIREAGYGLSDVNLAGCNLQLRAGVTLPAIAPLTINPRKSDGVTPLIPLGDANTDTLLVLYGNANAAPQGDPISAQPLVAPPYSYPNVYSVTSPQSFNTGDQVIAYPPPTLCNLTLTSVLGNDLSANVFVATGVPLAQPSTSRLYNLGPAPRIWAYAIRNASLTFCDYMVNDCSIAANAGNAAIWVPIASNIVSMRAQYGKDGNTPMDGMVNTYNQTTPTAACDWMKVLAVDIVLVARNGNFEKDIVTAAAPTWAGTSETPPIGIDLSANSNWQYYRYKTFETVIPMRNVFWLGLVPGC